jgi:hypothetical protein
MDNIQARQPHVELAAGGYQEAHLDNRADPRRSALLRDMAGRGTQNGILLANTPSLIPEF